MEGEGHMSARKGVIVLLVLVLAVMTGCRTLNVDSGKSSGLALDRGCEVKSKSVDVVNPVAMAGGPVKPDGELGEAAWKKAVAMTGFIAGADQPKVRTRVLVTCDKQNLYVAVVSEEPKTGDIIAKGTDENPDQVWRDDCVEVYVDPRNEKQGTRGYYGFFVNPNGAAYDRTRNGAWDGEWTRGARVLKGTGWTAELAIPFKTMGIEAKKGHKLGLMVARSRKPDGGGYYTLVPCGNEAKDTTKYPVLELK